jgi:hypothetical protein
MSGSACHDSSGLHRNRNFPDPVRGVCAVFDRDALGALVLVVISFILLAHFSGAPPNSTYIPAHIENGKFVPGVEK